MANPQNTPDKGNDAKSAPANRAAQLAEIEALAAAPVPERRDSLGKATLQLAGFFLILGAIGFGYKTYASNAGRLFEVIKETRDLQKQDSYDKLKETHEKLKEALAIKAEGRVLALMAETSTLLACTHLDPAFKEDAEKYTSQAANDDVKRAERYSAEGYLKTCNGQPVEAGQYMERIMTQGAMDSRIMHAYGVSLMAQGRWTEARDILKKAADSAAGNPRFPTAYGEAELALGNWYEAQQQFSRAVNSNGGHVRAKLGKLLTESIAGIPADKILKDLDKVLAGPPAASPGEAQFGAWVRAEVLARAGAYTNAQALVTQLIGTDKAKWKDVDGRFLLLAGRLAALKGEDAAAATIFAELAKKEPYNPNAYIIPATTYLELDKGAPALAVLQEYQKAKIPETPNFFALQGDALALTGKGEEAAKSYQQALEKEENNIRSILGTGRLLIEKKKWEEGGAMMEKVTTMQPDNGDPWYSMAAAYVEQKDLASACQMADKATELYKKKNAEPRVIIKALKRAAKNYELAKNKKEADIRLKEVAELEKLK